MECTALLNQAGISEDCKLKTLYSCLDADLKNEFGLPRNQNLNAYLNLIQTKAHVYRQKLLQQDQEIRARESRTINELISVFQQARSAPAVASAPTLPPYKPAASPSPQFNVTVATPPPASQSPAFAVAPQNASPFTGRPWRHCGGQHMDNACPTKSSSVSRLCRFCGQPHYDHACPQRLAHFKNCVHCNGLHYSVVCPSQPRESTPIPPPTFKNMQVGQPSPTASAAPVLDTAFVHSTSKFSEARPTAATVQRCGSYQAVFPTQAGLFSHAMLSGHQIDLEPGEAHQVAFTQADIH